jgi:hypothetical protein
LLGPDQPTPGSSERDQISWSELRALDDALNFMFKERRIPARVFIGPDPVAPSDFLYAIASAYLELRSTSAAPTEGGVRLGRALEVLPARRVAQDTPDLFGGWIIHKEGFRAPKILEVARQQAWTLKPAIASPAGLQVDAGR